MLSCVLKLWYMFLVVNLEGFFKLLDLIFLKFNWLFIREFDGVGVVVSV